MLARLVVLSSVLLSVAFVGVAMEGPSSVAAAPPRATTRVDTGGRIGRLHIDRSSREQVIAELGAPGAEGSGSFMIGYPDYESLGYSCRSTSVPALFPVGEIDNTYGYCRTVYFIDEDTGRLSALFTTDPSFLGPRGIHPGMSATKAERRLRRKAFVGCGTGIELHPKHGRAFLQAGVVGGRIVQRGKPVLLGGRISSFSLESERHPVGLTFC
jgi:hypothetical protein